MTGFLSPLRSALSMAMVNVSGPSSLSSSSNMIFMVYRVSVGSKVKVRSLSL